MLTPQDIQIIQDHQHASIVQKSLVNGQLDLIYDRQWFNIWVPKSLGGRELNLRDGLCLLEELAYWDGSLAWTVTLCSGANMFAGFIDKELAKAVFSQREVCLGGSGRVGGKAVWNGACYLVSGEWPYATGAPHLSHFTLNAYIYHGDQQQFDEAGKPLVCSFFVPKHDVLIHYDWDTFGLESTASHSFSLVDMPVERQYAFQLDTSLRVVDNALFRIPFRPFADVTLLVNYLGMYRRFIDLVQKYFYNKSKDLTWRDKFSKQRFQVLGGYEQTLAADRGAVQALVDELWRLACLGEVDSDHPVVQELYDKSRAIVKRIREAVVDLFPLLGIKAAQREEELNIVFRNLFTATQHSLLNIPMD